MRRALVLAAVIAALAALPSTAAAACRSEVRWIPDMSGQTGGSLILVPVCDGTGTSKPSAKQRKPTAKQLRTLRYVPRESVSAKVRDRMTQRLAYGPDAESIRAKISGGDLMRQFHAAVRKLHWSTSDLADMYAQAYIVMWLVVDPKQDATSAAVDRAVRSDIRDQLGLDRSFRRMSDGKQQELAEWLGSWAVVLAGTLNALRAQGDATKIEEFREQARDMIRRSELLGVDMTKYKLTRKGIERR